MRQLEEAKKMCALTNQMRGASISNRTYPSFTCLAATSTDPDGKSFHNSATIYTPGAAQP